MAILLNGICGGLSGRLGNLVFRYCRGITVVSRRPVRRKKDFSSAQLERQAKFALTGKFLSPLAPLLRQTYNRAPAGLTGFNVAFSCNIRHAVTGRYPAYAIDYTAVTLSRGSLPGPAARVFHSPPAGKLEWRWDTRCGPGRPGVSCRVWVAVYCEALDQWAFSPDAAAAAAGSCLLCVKAFRGKAVQTYIGFISPDGKWVSRTVYTGMRQVA